jgi:nucleoside-diphosphate-sugar epimerase
MISIPDNNLIAITGSSGFIGRKFIKSLYKNNLKLLVRSVDYSNPSMQVECDLNSLDIPSNFFSDVVTVFHLAGVAHDMRDASQNEHFYHRVNVDATVRLAELAVKSNVKRFVFVSSVKAGGSSSFRACESEKDQGNPEGIYGKTKREAELKLLKIGKESGMHVSIIRPSLVYGPNVKGNLQLMLSGIKKGWFPPLPETNNKRSMIHVDDLVRAILLVAHDDRANGEIFIATDGTPHSSRDIYNAMCSALGKSIPKWSMPKFLFDMASLINPRIKYKLNKLLGDECYSSTKLEALGFKAQKTLKDMNETSF